MRILKKFDKENICLKNSKSRLCAAVALFCFLFTACGGMEVARETEEIQTPAETEPVVEVPEVQKKNLDRWGDEVYEYSTEHRLQWGSSVVENTQYVFYTTKTQLIQMDKKSGEKTVLSRWKKKDVYKVTLYCTEDALYEILNDEVYCIDLHDGGRDVICTEEILEREGYSAPSNEIWGIAVHNGTIYLELLGFEIIAYDAENQRVEGKVAVDAVSCGFSGDFLFYRKHRSSDAIRRVNLHTKEDVAVREDGDAYSEVFVMNGSCYYQCGDKIYLYEESGQDVEIIANVLEYISSSGDVIYYRNSSGELCAYDVQKQKISESGIMPDPDGAYWLKSAYVVFDHLFYRLSSEEGNGLFPSLDISEFIQGKKAEVLN